MKKFVVLFFVGMLLTGCSMGKSVKQTSTAIEGTKSEHQHKFKLFKGNPKEIAVVKKELSSSGFSNVQVIPFDTGYQIDMTDRSTVNQLLNSVNTNDNSGYVKNDIEPMIKHISTIIHRKIYLPAGGPNNTLILIYSNGKLVYSVFNLANRMMDSLRAAGIKATVIQQGLHNYLVITHDVAVKRKYLQSQLNICRSIDPQAQFSIDKSH